MSSNTNGRGSFEACFATGLDLSEFGNEGKGGADEGTSASFHLLQVKEKEALNKEYQEMEEIRMQEIIQQRKEKMEKSRQKSTSASQPHAGQLLQTTLERPTASVRTDDKFLGALIGSIHGGSGEQVNQSRSSRKIEVNNRRRARNKVGAPKQKLSPSKSKGVANKRKSRVKY